MARSCREDVCTLDVETAKVLLRSVEGNIR